MLIAIFFVACTPAVDNHNHQGVLSIRHNLNDYSVETIPLNDPIAFELSTTELLSGLYLPQALETSYNTTIQNTTFYLTEVTERAEDEMLILTFGMKYNYQSPTRSMLSLFKPNDQRAFEITALIHMMDNEGEQLALASGSGDGEALKYEQWIGVQIPKKILEDNDRLFFEISNLNILTYKER